MHVIALFLLISRKTPNALSGYVVIFWSEFLACRRRIFRQKPERERSVEIPQCQILLSYLPYFSFRNVRHALRQFVSFRRWRRTKSRRGISEKVAGAILATLARGGGQGPRTLRVEMQDCPEIFMQELIQEQEE